MKHTVISFTLLIFMGYAVSAQEINIIDTLRNVPISEVTLITDISNCIKKKNKEEYQSGVLRFENGPLIGQSFDIDLRARGNMRKVVCYIPPLKVKFPKGQFEYRKIKWVNVCKDNTIMQTHLLQEYLVYKLYEIVTDYSYRTALMRVNYCLPETPNEIDFTNYAYIIEPEDQLAERFEGKPYHPRVLSPDILSKDEYNMMIAFEYIVANTDWAVENQHNLTLITDRKKNAIVPVPYDFDYTGFVNTSYATPNTYTPITLVTERYNRGHCMEEASALRIRNHFLSKKDELIAVINNFELISEKSRKQNIRFIEKSFQDFESEKAFISIFCKNCKDY